MHNVWFFVMSFKIIITDVRDVALFVGVLGAGQILLVLKDPCLVARSLASQ